MLQLSELKIAIIGLGYVGLPLAVEFGKQVPVVGFDIHQKRINELKSGQDHTLEVSPEELKQAHGLSYTSNLEDLKTCSFFIVTVPTPIDQYKQPDLSPLIKASTSIGKILKKGDIVVYESTVYPGATEEVCIPELERVSGLKFNQDFFAGYSPERINPGDKLHRVTNILKITSGSTPEVAEFVDQVYNLIIEAGTHKAASIKVAEAAKVIENTQRDVNIALINELALIFNKMGIDTEEVLKAAGTKWNFLPFRPGLVGGHCIGVDPYYLTAKAESVGYHPEVILAGRRINNSMGKYVAEQTMKLLSQVEPEDLIKFGLIPEFIGRLPVVATLNELSEEALIQILKEPKNALTKQYQALFNLEGVDLEFREEALDAIAKKAMARKTGARGLRSIVEAALLDTMYDLPSMEDVEKVVIDESVIGGQSKPLLIYGKPEAQQASGE